MSAGESRLDFMPIADRFLAELPAEADIMPAMAADEIDQTHLIIFQVATDAVQLIDITLEIFNLPVELNLYGLLVFVLG